VPVTPSPICRSACSPIRGERHGRPCIATGLASHWREPITRSPPGPPERPRCRSASKRPIPDWDYRVPVLEHRGSPQGGLRPVG
jgi:hypothetical protein